MIMGIQIEALQGFEGSAIIAQILGEAHALHKTEDHAQNKTQTTRGRVEMGSGSIIHWEAVCEKLDTLEIEDHYIDYSIVDQGILGRVGWVIAAEISNAAQFSIIVLIKKK